ncbi:hypothetical protein LNP27_09280 [Flavobacterium galactosidilyticum]|nr:hypothetical protein [Flavobacterium sp. F-340]UFH45326.1 hypothetical protein LNP27_09280 [Flavobacterium sp. F-340]
MVGDSGIGYLAGSVGGKSSRSRDLEEQSYNHTNLTGLEKVNGEHSLIMLVYNIKRSINILGVSDLIAKLKKWNSPYKAKVYFVCITNYFRVYKDIIKNELQFAA